MEEVRIPQTFVLLEHLIAEDSFYSSQKNWVWWCLPVISATREAEIGGSKFEANPDKS
jgi:hypothetical protein